MAPGVEQGRGVRETLWRAAAAGTWEPTWRPRLRAAVPRSPEEAGSSRAWAPPRAHHPPLPCATVTWAMTSTLSPRPLPSFRRPAPTAPGSVRGRLGHCPARSGPLSAEAAAQIGRVSTMTSGASLWLGTHWPQPSILPRHPQGEAGPLPCAQDGRPCPLLPPVLCPGSPSVWPASYSPPGLRPVLVPHSSEGWPSPRPRPPHLEGGPVMDTGSVLLLGPEPQPCRRPSF